MENQTSQPNPPAQQPPETPIVIKKGKSVNWLLISSIAIFAFVTLLLIGTLGYLLNSNKISPTKISTQTTTTPTPTPTPTIDPTANWKIYTNDAFRWSIKYPPSLEAFDSKLNDQSVIYIDTPEVASAFKSKPIYEGPMKFMISTSTGSMPTSFPYTNGSSVNPTIKNISVNGYSGIRGQETSTIGLVDQVFLQNPKGGYGSIQSMGDSNFDQMLSTFKFTN